MTTASKLLSTDLSTSEKFAECQLFCESQATDGCCEFRDQANPWCLFKESGIPREQTTRTPGGSETYSVSCVREEEITALGSHFVACGRPGSCGGGTAYELDSLVNAVRCVMDSQTNGWFHKLQDDRCNDRFPNLWWRSDFGGNCHEMNFMDAEAFCSSLDARLPTLKEAEDGCVANSGCGWDKVQIWTSSTASTSLPSAAPSGSPSDSPTFAPSSKPSASPTLEPTSDPSLLPTTSPTVAAVGVCDTLSTNERYHLCGHMENGELVGHGWQRTTASKLLSTDLSTSEKFAECQLFCESQATDGCCEFRDQANPWCLFKESGIPREQTTRTPGGSETYSVSCVREEEITALGSHFVACGRPGSCGGGTAYELDSLVNAVRCVMDSQTNGWFHKLQDDRCNDRFPNLWWRSDFD